MPHEDDTWKLLNAVPDAIILVDAASGIVFANQQAETMFGASRDQLSGLQVDELLPERFRKKHVAHRARYGARPTVRPMSTDRNLYAVRRDGKEFPVDISLSPVQTADGTLVAAAIRDISDRIELREKLRESAWFNRAVLSSLRDHIAVLDQNGTVIAVNDAWTEFAKLNGADTGVALGKGFDYPGICRKATDEGDETAREALSGIQAVLSGEAPVFALEYPCHSRTEQRWFLMQAVALRRDEGGAVVSHTSITERKLSELRLKDALEEIEALRDRLRMENVYLQEEIKSAHNFKEIVGNSEELKLTLQKIDIVAPTDSNVLILGETGTGKELIARAIHDRSLRNDRPMVKVNCAALPSTLIESALFGHVKGAFTGAVANHTGRFELADGGTIFLDEIGDLSPDLQVKLLRILQEGEFERLGASETKKVDVRVIAATNRDLAKSMDDETFRSDLYYRLAVFPIEVPPLRFRKADIPLLVWHFIHKKQAGLRREIQGVPEASMNALVQYDWPGNVRELENVVERALLLSPGSTLVFDSFPSPPRSTRGFTNDSSRRDLDKIERLQITEVLEHCGWKIKGSGNAAERLGLSPSTLRYRMNKLGIQRPSKRPR
jgi:PAS domain S-box-containing protein